MGAKTKVHNIRDIFYNVNLLEGAVPVEQADGTFAIKNFTLIKAGLSKNKNFYSEKVLRKAEKVFEGKDIRTDHPSLFDPQSVHDVIGKLTKTWYSKESKAIKGNAVFSSTAEDILTKVREGFIGDLSINARGETQQREGPDGNIRRDVLSIDEGYSVDLVCNAAAGGNLHEDYRKNMLACERMRGKMEELQDIQEEELREARPDLVKSIEQQAVKAALAESEKGKEDKEDKTEVPSALSRKDIGDVVKEQIDNIFKSRDEKAKLDADKSTLNKGISTAIDDVLKESDVDDAIKAFIRENLVQFCGEKFKSIDKIDKKVLSEERDVVLKNFAEIASKLDSKSSKDGKNKGDNIGKKPAGLMAFMP